MSRIGLLGDIHGNKRYIKFALWKFHEESINTVLQVGDFGIYQDQSSLEYLKLANLEAAKYGITLFIVPGNHEDWRYINKTIDKKSSEDGWAPLRSNILLAPRPHRWTWDGISFVGLSGAPSVDRGWRRRADAAHPNAKNPLWDPGEAITLQDVYNTVQGGYAEVMVGHDAPMGVPTIDDKIKDNPFGFETADLLYAADGRALMDQAFRGVEPKTFIHGHYHVAVNDMIRRPLRGGYSDLEPERDLWTHVIGLDCDGTRSALGHFDTKLHEGFIWDVNKDMARYQRGGTW